MPWTVSLTWAAAIPCCCPRRCEGLRRCPCDGPRRSLRRRRCRGLRRCPRLGRCHGLRCDGLRLMAHVAPALPGRHERWEIQARGACQWWLRWVTLAFRPATTTATATSNRPGTERPDGSAQRLEKWRMTGGLRPGASATMARAGAARSAGWAGAARNRSSRHGGQAQRSRSNRGRRGPLNGTDRATGPRSAEIRRPRCSRSEICVANLGSMRLCGVPAVSQGRDGAPFDFAAPGASEPSRCNEQMNNTYEPLRFGGCCHRPRPCLRRTASQGRHGRARARLRAPRQDCPCDGPVGAGELPPRPLGGAVAAP